MAVEDITKLVERLEVLEERMEVHLQSLYAGLRYYNDGSVDVVVRGELHPRNGTTLSHTLKLIVAAYDSSSKIVGHEDEIILAANFFAFGTFQIVVDVSTKQLTKIRIYPQKF